METWTYPDTTGWNEYPFNFDGYNFVSKVAPNADIMPQIKRVGIHNFIDMNIQALSELIGVGRTLSEIKENLAFINQGGIEAVIELA